MAHRITITSLVFSLLLASALLQAAPPEKASRLIPSHYIIVFKENIDTDKATHQLLRRFSALQVNLRYRHALRGIAVKIPQQLLAKIAADANVAYIEQDVIITLNAQTLPTGINRVNAELDATANIDGIDDRVNADIAILDTGIDLDHPDLNVFNFTYCKTQGPVNANCVDGDPDANDINSHGTHVAGIAAALDNSIGVVGVAPGARLWAVKVLEDDGTGAGSQIIAGVDYVAQHAAEIEVANMSLVGNGEFQALDDAIAGAVAAGVVFTLAAGNAHIDVALVFPSGHPSAITVSAFEDYDGVAGGLSATAGDDTFANFSNFGAGVNIMAPGVSIRSTVPDGGLANFSGTSMAAPHVAGAAALYMSLNPGASPITVRNALISAGDPAPCVNNADGVCGSPEDPDGIQEPLLLLTCDDADRDGVCDTMDNCPTTANPDQANNDLDAQGDVCDSDDDNDGLLDTAEAIWGSDPFNTDSDADGLNDGDEVNIYTTLPTNPDTDGDGLTDGDEIVYGYDPLQSSKGDLAPRGLHDNNINVGDLLILIRLVHQRITPTGAEAILADMNSDGVLNVADILLLTKIVTGNN
jgi:hypothetical protein